MSTPKKILIYGRDPMLLETRQRILEHEGYSVLTADPPSRGIEVMASSKIDLLILCHSLSTDECHGILSVLQDRQPQAKSLSLVAARSGCRDQLLSEVLDAMQGPAKLVSTVTKLVDPTDSASH